MPIGDLNKRITIQAATKVNDDMGGFIIAWADIDTIWAAIWPIGAKELILSMQNVMEITHRVRIRYRSVLRPEWRLKFGTRYFAILSIINPNERNEWLDLICKEVV